MRFQRLRAAAEEETASVRETLRHVQDELNEERSAAAIAEQEQEILRLEREEQDQNGTPGAHCGANATSNERAAFRVSEDARMAALPELQRVRAQLDYFRDSDADQKLKISQLEDQVNALREAKRRTEMHTIRVEEAGRAGHRSKIT